MSRHAGRMKSTVQCEDIIHRFPPYKVADLNTQCELSANIKIYKSHSVCLAFLA